MSMLMLYNSCLWTILLVMSNFCRLSCFSHSNLNTGGGITLSFRRNERHSFLSASPQSAAEEGFLGFYIWLQQNGADTGPLFIDEDCVGNTRGVKMAEFAESTSKLLQIPIQICITDSDQHFLKTPLGQKLGENEVSKISKIGKLATTLIHEKRKGEKSFYSPYLKILPAQPPSLLTRWNQEELDRLQDDYIINEVFKPEFIKQETIYAQVLKAGKDHTLEDKHLPTSDEFQWAMDIRMAVVLLDIFHLRCTYQKAEGNEEIRSRGFLIPGTDGSVSEREDVGITGAGIRAMVPFLDMLNSDPGKREVVLSTSSTEKGLVLQLRAVGNLPPQVEVFNNYGEENNDFYILNYGFVPERNPYDRVRTPGLFSKEDVKISGHEELGQERINLMSTIVESNGGSFDLYERNIQNDLVKGLRLLYATEEEINTPEGQKWLDIFSSDSSDSPISSNNEKLVAQALERRCDLLLSGFPTSMDEDYEALRTLTLEEQKAGGHCTLELEKEMLAVTFRLKRKEILQKLKGRLSDYTFQANFRADLDSGGKQKILTINTFLSQKYEEDEMQSRQGAAGSLPFSPQFNPRQAYYSNDDDIFIDDDDEDDDFLWG